MRENADQRLKRLRKKTFMELTPEEIEFVLDEMVWCDICGVSHAEDEPHIPRHERLDPSMLKEDALPFEPKRIQREILEGVKEMKEKEEEIDRQLDELEWCELCQSSHAGTGVAVRDCKAD